MNQGIKTNFNPKQLLLIQTLRFIIIKRALIVVLSIFFLSSLGLAKDKIPRPNFQPTNREIYEALMENRIRLERFEAKVDAKFKEIEKRFEDINRRFEDINRRFDQMMHFLYILAAIFTTLTATVIGFAYWDRRTILKRAKEEAEERVKELDIKKVAPAIESLRRLAKKYPEVAEVLRQFNLL